jgi:hypothetical protein
MTRETPGSERWQRVEGEKEEAEGRGLLPGVSVRCGKWGSREYGEASDVMAGAGYLLAAEDFRAISDRLKEFFR